MKKIITSIILSLSLLGSNTNISKADDNFILNYQYRQTGEHGAIQFFTNNFNNGDFFIAKFEDAPMLKDVNKIQKPEDLAAFRNMKQITDDSGINNLNNVVDLSEGGISYVLLHNHTSDGNLKSSYFGIDKSQKKDSEIKVTVYKGRTTEQLLVKNDLDKATGNVKVELNDKVVPVGIKGDLDTVKGLEKAEFTIKPGESKKLTKADFKPVK